MAFISEIWPCITPWNVETLPLHWWVYYVRAAMKRFESMKEANRGVR